jgi:5-methylthioribose kinase
MINLGPDNVLEYLRSNGHLAPETSARAELLAWGVSNVVMRISLKTGDDFVLKQSREQLQTEKPWFSRLDRIWRETDYIRTVAPLLPSGVIPHVLFEDRENYVFAMEAVEADHIVWKAELLAGRADPQIAITAGEYLATIHRETAFDEELKIRWRDHEVFIQLRVDPFYCSIAEVHPEIRFPIRRMTEEMFQNTLCAVHADFSPKNILITKHGLSLVDFETGHFGDPAFDLGFFLSHLLLKTVLHADDCENFLNLARKFWNSYSNEMESLTRSEKKPFAEDELQRRTILHLAGCMLARIDGTSTVDYLSGQTRQEFVRNFCRDIFFNPPSCLSEVFERLQQQLEGSDLSEPH